MADMHLIDGDLDGSYRIVMHFAVPAGNNAIGVPYSTALVNSGLSPESVLPDGDGNNGTISATEKAALLAGTVVEHVETFRLETGGTTAGQIRASLRAHYTKVKIGVLAHLQHRLRYFGHNESES